MGSGPVGIGEIFIRLAMFAAIVLPFGVWLLLYLWRDERRRKDRLQQWEQFRRRWEEEVAPLSIEEAMQRAEAVLADPAKFECVERPSTEEERQWIEPFAPYLRAFFERYAVVSSARDTFLSREHIEPSDEGPPFIYLGRNGESEGLDVKPGDEVIYIGGEPAYPSIYHYWLFVDWDDFEYRR